MHTLLALPTKKLIAGEKIPELKFYIKHLIKVYL